ncbi:hypothetical protein ACFYYR_18400 [Streptomyces sp. NPDC001922]|uniref:hypothetical protein n=1 Tax=Streptomyces sp. NPDC001922 TaxID=3364624 RepID=UPI0036C63503
MAPALRLRFAIGLLAGAVLLPAPAAFALEGRSAHVPGRTPDTWSRDHSIGRTPGLRPGPQLALPVIGLPSPLLAELDGRVAEWQRSRDPGGPFAGRLAGEGRARPGRGPDSAARPEVPPGVPERPGARNPSAPDEARRPNRPAVPPSPGAGISRPPEPHGSAKPDTSETGRDRLEAERPRSPRPAESGAAEPDEPVTSTTGPDGPSATGESTGQTVAQHSGRMLRVLPLGTGLALMGIGLAFIGFRLRQR